jgi:hypothetical protein
MISPLKDLPIRAIPFVVFLAACTTFGELFIHMPMETFLQQTVSGAMAVFTMAAGFLFFSQCFFGWPPMRGLDLPD